RAVVAGRQQRNVVLAGRGRRRRARSLEGRTRDRNGDAGQRAAVRVAHDPDECPGGRRGERSGRREEADERERREPHRSISHVSSFLSCFLVWIHIPWAPRKSNAVATISVCSRATKCAAEGTNAGPRRTDCPARTARERGRPVLRTFPQILERRARSGGSLAPLPGRDTRPKRKDRDAIGRDGAETPF